MTYGIGVLPLQHRIGAVGVVIGKGARTVAGLGGPVVGNHRHRSIKRHSTLVGHNRQRYRVGYRPVLADDTPRRTSGCHDVRLLAAHYPVHVTPLVVLACAVGIAVCIGHCAYASCQRYDWIGHRDPRLQYIPADILYHRHHRWSNSVVDAMYLYLGRRAAFLCDISGSLYVVVVTPHISQSGAVLIHIGVGLLSCAAVPCAVYPRGRSCQSVSAHVFHHWQRCRRCHRRGQAFHRSRCVHLAFLVRCRHSVYHSRVRPVARTSGTVCEGISPRLRPFAVGVCTACHYRSTARDVYAAVRLHRRQRRCERRVVALHRVSCGHVTFKDYRVGSYRIDIVPYIVGAVHVVGISVGPRAAATVSLYVCRCIYRVVGIGHIDYRLSAYRTGRRLLRRRLAYARHCACSAGRLGEGRRHYFVGQCPWIGLAGAVGVPVVEHHISCIGACIVAAHVGCANQYCRHGVAAGVSQGHWHERVRSVCQA